MLHQKLLILLGCLIWTTSLFAQLPVSTSPEKKNAVLEEFTGINCYYCPDGHSRANEQASEHAGDVFLINIHTGGFAHPGPDEPDYRTPFGSAIDSQAIVDGYPAGTVDRHFFPSYTAYGGTAINRAYWRFAIDSILMEDAYANLALEGLLNEDTRELTVDLEVYFTDDGAETNHLNVALLQDSIWGPQNGGDTYQEHWFPNRDTGKRYLHMHMLRHLITGQWGDVISNTSQGTLIEKEYSYTVPQEYNGIPVDLDDLKLVAFLDTGHFNIITGNSGPIAYTNTGIEEVDERMASLDLYPNPVTDRARVDIQVEEPVEGRIEVRDLTGRIVKSEQVNVRPGGPPMNLDMSAQESGMYIFRFIGEEGSATERFSVIER